jgi:hypothetical protein
MIFHSDSIITELVAKHLGIPFEGVSSLYKHIKEETEFKLHKPLLVSKKEVVIPDLYDIEYYLLTGIDLPTVVSSNKGLSRKIMVIGSEPLRSWDYFMDHNLSVYDHIAVSTPYALHQPNANETLYYKIIEHLAKTHQIYLTDLRKIWFAGFERHKTFLEAKIHHAFLLDEINNVNPECIITFGKNVYDALSLIAKKNNLNIKIHYLIHPSQRTQGEGRKSFFQKAGIDISKYNSIKSASDRNVMPYIEYLNKTL